MRVRLDDVKPSTDGQVVTRVIKYAWTVYFPSLDFFFFPHEKHGTLISFDRPSMYVCKRACMACRQIVSGGVISSFDWPKSQGLESALRLPCKVCVHIL